jgi:hypothetical protein
MRSGRVYMPPTQGGAIAQLGERLNGIQEVVGSIPIGSTKPSSLTPVVAGCLERPRRAPIVNSVQFANSCGLALKSGMNSVRTGDHRLTEDRE